MNRVVMNEGTQRLPCFTQALEESLLASAVGISPMAVGEYLPS